MKPAPVSLQETAAPAVRGRGRVVLVAALLVAMTVAVYGRTGRHDFITFDDELYVTKNPRVLQGLGGSGVSWAFSTLSTGNYHPLAWLSHMADVDLFGLDAGRHHLVNVSLHVLNTILLFHVLFRMTGAMFRSAFVAALFAVHPLHVESVAWVAERKDLLATFFFLLTLRAYVNFVEKRTAARYAAVFVLAAMGLLSKAILVTIPFVLLLLDYWPLGRFERPGTCPPPGPAGRVPLPWRWLVLEKLPLAGLSLAACVVALAAQTAAGATDSSGAYPLGFRVANATISCGTYLAKMFWPSALAVYYPYPATGLAAWKVALAGAALLSITALAVFEARRRPFLLAGWLWYLGTLVPVIGLVQVGQQAMADRYTYIPLVGIFVALAWGAFDLMSKVPNRSRILGVAGGAAVVVLAVCAWRQVGYWRDSGNLYEHALEATSDNWMMHNNLGVIRVQQGRLDEALRHYAEALRIEPGFAMSNFNVGEILLLKGDVDRSVRYLGRAAELAPGNAVVRLVLGTALSRQGRLDEAVFHLREAARLDPADPEIRRALGMALARQEAIRVR